MNSEDKADFHNSLVKNISRKCHEKCFNQESKLNMPNVLNMNCLSACYHKYVNVISKLRTLSAVYGEKLDSQFISAVYETKKDELLDLIWNPGGSKYMRSYPFTINIKYVNKRTIMPYKGFSPYRDELENK
jgi:hypothetical protein